jgi:ABC-type antimicrobial peptide transport system permease subunit
MATKNKDGSEKTLKQLLAEGLTDFIGFAGGAFLCYWVGTLMGFNMAVAGNTSNVGIVSVVVMLIGGGAGLKLARRLR